MCQANKGWLLLLLSQKGNTAVQALTGLLKLNNAHLCLYLAADPDHSRPRVPISHVC